MASPTNAYWRKESIYDWCGKEIQRMVKGAFTTDAVGLDVGAGWGKYRYLLPKYTLDACEIWEPYVKKEKLKNRYREVIIKDICDYRFKWYDFVILGDVLEHIARPQAQRLLDYICSRCEELYVAVPFLYPQAEEDGNPYEEHKQDDLTPELMETEYPMLKLVATNGEKGIYIKS